MSLDIFKRCFDLLRSWWQVDRVRISPQEGRLLRLQPSCVLVLDGKRIVVQTRRLERQATRLWVVYDCLAEAGAGELWVAADSVHRAMHWLENDTNIELEDADIMVLGASQ